MLNSVVDMLAVEYPSLGLAVLIGQGCAVFSTDKLRPSIIVVLEVS